MYIPTIFLGAQSNCIECDFSQSIIPDGVTIGNVTSGSDTWFYIKVEANSSVTFDVVGGVTSQAKLLLVGGGGYKDGTIPTGGAGGGAAGSVIWQDVLIQPQTYFMSASVGGTSAVSETGGPATFIVDYDNPDPSKWYQIIANGGGPNEVNNAGGNNDDFSGGSGQASLGGEPGGGGGAGSTGNGEDGAPTPGTPNSTTGGDGGSGSYIPAPFSDVVGFDTVGCGGPGDGDVYGQYPGPYNAYGNGGSNSDGGTDDGRPGVAVLFIPINGCTTSSLAKEDFRAEGGSTGTFYSGSVQYKYHYFNNTSIDYTFNVTNGYTDEAIILTVGAGAGSSTYAREYVYGPNTYMIQEGGGAGAGEVFIQENALLAFRNNLPLPGSGGAPFTNGYDSNITSKMNNLLSVTALGGGAGSGTKPLGGTINSQDGGSGGGGDGLVDDIAGLSIGTGFGNDGGNGTTGGVTPMQKSAGGGGGGAGSTGSNAIVTDDTTTTDNRYAKGGRGWNIEGFWSFLTGSVYTGNPRIAVGGSGSAGWYASNPTPPLPAPPGADNEGQANDGSGANPNDNTYGNNGIVVIVYPISGSISNSGGPSQFTEISLASGSSQLNACSSSLSSSFFISSSDTLQSGTFVYQDSNLTITASNNWYREPSSQVTFEVLDGGATNFESCSVYLPTGSLWHYVVPSPGSATYSYTNVLDETITGSLGAAASLFICAKVGTTPSITGGSAFDQFTSCSISAP